MTTTLSCRSEPSHATASGAARPPCAPRRPVRVCFLIDELTKAGTETQLLALIERLDRCHVQPFLCLLRGQDEYSRVLEPDNCPVLRLGVGSLRHPAMLAKAWQLVRFLRRESIDVVLSTLSGTAHSYCAVLVPVTLRCPSARHIALHTSLGASTGSFWCRRS